MKKNHIIRRFLLLAILCIFSFSPAAAISYAIDPLTCDEGGYTQFLKQKLSRVTTLAKFMSLNLGKNDYGGGLQNPQRWVLDDYINNQVKLLMGDTQDAISRAQSIYGGTPNQAFPGIADISTEINKDLAGPFDVVFYCDELRLGRSTQDPIVLDADATYALKKDIVFSNKVLEGCAQGGEHAPAYLFWQVGPDAARITFCHWFLDQAMRSESTGNPLPSDTSRIPGFLEPLYRVFGTRLWSQGSAGLPSIEKFRLFDGIMISALTHMRPMGSRTPTPPKGTTTDDTGAAVMGTRATWADVVEAAGNKATLSTSGAYVYLMLAVFAYRSGFTVDNTGQLNGYVEVPVGQDWGDATKDWVGQWRRPPPS